MNLCCEADNKSIVVERNDADLSLVEMDMKQIRIYHMVQLLPVPGNPLTGVYCVPRSWIKWQDQECATVLLAYPDELQKITRERIKNYGGPERGWHLYLAEIKYTTDFYDSVIRCINESKYGVEEHNGAEVTCTEIENPDSSASLNSSLRPGMVERNTFWLEWKRWINRQPDSDDIQLSIVNRIFEVVSPQSEVSESLMVQDVDNDDNNVPLDLSKAPRKPKLSHINNNTCGATDDSSTSRGIDQNWTLKHREYAPELVELELNSGVYITKTELDYCLKSSKKCTQLTRMLIKRIFSESALKNCEYGGIQKGRGHLQLKTKVTAAIVSFVLNYGLLQNWRPSSAKAIKGAIWYQLSLFKKKS